MNPRPGGRELNVWLHDDGARLRVESQIMPPARATMDGDRGNHAVFAGGEQLGAGDSESGTTGLLQTEAIRRCRSQHTGQ